MKNSDITKNKAFLPWFVYLVECEDGALYTGITTNVQRRFEEHQGLHGNKGAKFFRSKKAKKIVHVELYENRSQATKRESQIKKYSSKKKQTLVLSSTYQL